MRIMRVAWISSLHAFWRSLSVLRRTLLCTTALFTILEVWRPCYFLTDDNLSVGLPFLTEMGRNLKSGESPFFSFYLFGGHYDWARDVMYFNWTPLNFLVSLLADTPGRFWMLDLIAFPNFLLAAAGFLLLATTVKNELQIKISDGRLMFYTLSFVFSTFILTCGAGWINYLTNQAVLPWLALGLWQKEIRGSLGLLILFSLHQALGGQLAATISNGLVLTIFSILTCCYRRNWQSLILWTTANLITLAVISPLLTPSLDGFFHSQRGGGLSVQELTKFAMPAELFPISFLLGNFFEMIAYFAHLQDASLFFFPRMPTLMAFAAAWCIFPPLVNGARWTLLQVGCVGIICLLIILIIRPIEITAAMSHVPILRSMRWPFREILQLLFFLHLFLVLRPAAGSIGFQNRLACVSLTFFALPLFFTRPLTLNALSRDRSALFSGKADRFWSLVKKQLRPGDQIATIMDPDLWYQPRSFNKLPYSLAGTADFPAYFRVHCISGYSQTPPVDQLPITIRPYYLFGAYAPDQVAALTQGHPEIRIITVKSIDPLALELSAPAGGPPIDLTPLLSR